MHITELAEKAQSRESETKEVSESLLARARSELEGKDGEIAELYNKLVEREKGGGTQTEETSSLDGSEDMTD